MNITEIRRYEMLIRVKELGAAHADAFPASSVGGQMFAAVAAAVDQLHGHVAAQASGRGAVKEATTSKAAARTTLRGTLEAISHTSRALALDTPGIADKFRVPRSRNDQRLLGAARAFIVDAQPLLDAFVTHNLPASFLTDLQADIDALEYAIHEQAVGEESHIAARASITRAMGDGLTAVQHLDAMVPNGLRHDSAAIAVWTSARHVERTRRAASTPSPAPTPPADPVAHA